MYNECIEDPSLELLKAFLSIIRMRHTGQVVGIVTILSIKSHGFSIPSLLAILSFLFLSIALFSFDDAHDSASDRIVHPKRPIPRGTFTVTQVYVLGSIFFGSGLLIAYGLQLFQFILFLVVAVLGLLVIFVNLSSLVKATLTAIIIFILFPFSAHLDVTSFLFGLIVALPHIAGSMIKDFIHSPGDKIVNLSPPAEWLRYVAVQYFLLVEELFGCLLCYN
ncbi:MAG: hypothetical protein ACFFBD_25445 [Candidatus Hodarchaeota archaeon]